MELGAGGAAWRWAAPQRKENGLHRSLHGSGSLLEVSSKGQGVAFLSTDWETAGNLIAEPSCDPIQGVA